MTLNISLDKIALHKNTSVFFNIFFPAFHQHFRCVQEHEDNTYSADLFLRCFVPLYGTFLCPLLLLIQAVLRGKITHPKLATRT